MAKQVLSVTEFENFLTYEYNPWVTYAFDSDRRVRLEFRSARDGWEFMVLVKRQCQFKSFSLEEAVNFYNSIE